ncbi:CPW-WPC family protein [Hepatocystis sp. ex Piliocolobus tephrosceles]|nr:CPW-WPC family protein [Hepatocystis sp. ex Piliocolobus tephrosceles]
MRICTVICLCLSVGNIINYGASTNLLNNNNRTFNFSGDLNLKQNDNIDKKIPNNNNGNQDNEINKIVTESAKMKKSDEQVKESFDEATNAIKKKYNINELPTSGLDEILEDSNDVCDEDYSLPCPLNFFRTSSGCVPLETYKGPCNKVQDKLMYLSDNQKESWSEICETNWPCMPLTCPYGIDYDTICPINWVGTENGVCTSIYENNKCKYEINFLNKTIDEKKKLEKLCGIRWKCKSINYKTDFNSICPLNWIHMYDYKCKAPNDYTGPCPKISNLKKYNNEEGKKYIEIACLVNWPYTIEVNEQRDYYASCPIGWSLLSNGSCQAPENYEKSFKCNDVVSFANMNVQQKESYSTACNVDFPFKNRNSCRKDYSFLCPLGWIPSAKEGYCKAPIEYKSKICKPLAKYKNISNMQINYYLKFCNIDWPCEGEIRNSLIYTKISAAYSIEEKKRSSGPVESETGLIK